MLQWVSARRRNPPINPLIAENELGCSGTVDNLTTTSQLHHDGCAPREDHPVDLFRDAQRNPALRSRREPLRVQAVRFVAFPPE